MSNEYNFDPSELFRRLRARQGPRVVGPRRRQPRWRRVLFAVVALLFVISSAGLSLIGLRVRYLFLDNLGHSTVFWTPLVTQVVLFVIGFLLTAGLLAISIPAWRAVAGNLDERAPRIVTLAGLALCAVAGLIGGSFLASQWMDILLFLHGHSFGQVDPVFHQDYSFFLFRLPVYDAIQGIGWGVAVVTLLSAIGLGALCLAIEYSPEEVPVPLRPPLGGSPRNGLRIACLHAGAALVAIFVLAALGAHFGVYHLATSQQDNFVGLDATQRDVVKPILGVLQFLALALAVVTVVVVLRRRRAEPIPTAITLGSLLGGWLLVAGLLQAVPAAIYRTTRVDPNASTLQLPPITDYLATSRYAWALDPAHDVDTTRFGSPPGTRPVTPTAADLTADPGTLRDIRIQDTQQLPEVFHQIDTTKPYQTYPRVTVDRYPSANGETEVMLAPREISEASVPSQGFVNANLQFTHGYGITAASVNRLGNEGKPDLLAGNQPLRLLAPDAPPDLAVSDPRIYCGLETTQPIVVNTQQKEFDFVGRNGEESNQFGPLPGGIRNPGAFDRLALSLNQFNGFDLFLTSQLEADSRVFLHRDIKDRIAQVAPFLTVDGDPYVVADQASGHLLYVADTYVTSDRFPESFRAGGGVSYMRNAVKAVVDARTCETTLYAVDLSEPLTASYDEIFPGLFTPISRMPEGLRAHLRYPEDLFQAQSQVYAAAHIDPKNPIDLFNKGDLYRISQEQLGSGQGETPPKYVELTLPGDAKPSFVLLQTFSPARGSSTGGGESNVLTTLLAARCDYGPDNQFHPHLVSIKLNTQDNVLGPLQFDNNLNTDNAISSERTLLSTSGSSVVLGNVIVLPFNNRSFLYVRPLYVQASNGSFPQLRFVLVGTQDKVAQGTSLPEALQNLFGQPVAGLSTPSPGPEVSPSPGASPGPSPTPGPPSGLSAQAVQLIQKLLDDQAAAQAALKRGDFTAFGKAEDAVQQDTTALRALLGPAVSVGPSPSPSASGSPSASSTPRP